MPADGQQFASGCPARPDVALLSDIIVEYSDPIKATLQGTRLSGRSWMSWGWAAGVGEHGE